MLAMWSTIRRRRSVRRRGRRGGRSLGHQPRVSIGPGYVDFKLVTDNAIYRDDRAQYVIEWVTQQDVDLARRSRRLPPTRRSSPTDLGQRHRVGSTPRPPQPSPRCGPPADRERRSAGPRHSRRRDRDASARVRIWSEPRRAHDPRQRFHIEVYVAPEVAEQRIAAAVAAGGTVVDDSDAPSLTVIADQDGNTGTVCVDVSAARKD